MKESSIFILNKMGKVISVLTNAQNPNRNPFYDDVLTQDLATGADTYKFTTVFNKKNSKTLKVGNQVAFMQNGECMLFQIISVTNTHDENMEIEVYCECAGLSLINHVVRKQNIPSCDIQTLLNAVLQDSDWNVGYVDERLIKTLEVNLETAPVYSTIQNYIKQFGAEISFRCEVNRNRVISKFVNAYFQRGRYKGKRFEFGKNVDGIIRDVDSSELYTALIGEGKDGLTFEDIELPEIPNKPKGQDFVFDQQAFDKYNQNGYQIMGVFKYDTESKEELLRETYKKLQDVKTPKIKYTVTVDVLDDTVEIGDTVNIIDHYFSPSLLLQARVNKIEKSVSGNTITKIELSNYREVQSNIGLSIELLDKVKDFVDGSVTNKFPIGTDDIKDDAITSDKVQDGAIGNGQLAGNAVSGDKVQEGAITGDKIQTGTIVADNIQSGAITTDKLQANSITTDKLQAEVITSDKIHANSITTDKLQANIIESGHIKSDTIETKHLKSDIITSDKIHAGSITADKIQSDSIQSNHIQANTIETVHLKANSITGDKIQSNTIETKHLKAGIIDAEHIQAGAITTDKLHAGSVTADKIQAGSITAGSGIIADGAIGSAQISYLEANKIRSGTLDTSYVTVTGADGHLTISGNQIMVNDEGKNRVTLGEYKTGTEDETKFGLLVRDEDGETIMIDGKGVHNAGITDGAIDNNKVNDNANIEGYKLNIDSVIREVNENGTEVIKGTRVQVGDRSLEVELSTQNNRIEENSIELSTQKSQITALDNKIDLKVDNQKYKEDKIEIDKKIENSKNEAIEESDKNTDDKLNKSEKKLQSYTDIQIDGVNKHLSKATSEIQILQNEITSKVSQADVDKTVANIKLGGRNYLLMTGEPSVTVGNNTPNQLFEIYKLSTLKTILGQNATVSFEWSVEGDSVGGSFYLQLNNEPYTRLSEIIKISDDNKSGSCVYKFEFPKDVDKLTTGVMCRQDYMTGTLTIKNLILTTGVNEVTWTPAPEDVNETIINNIKVVEDKISNVETTLKQDLNGIRMSVQDLDKKTTKVEGDITLVGNGLKDYVDTEVKATHTTINSLESSLDVLKEEITSKVSKQEVDNSLIEVGDAIKINKENISGVGSKITQLADSVKTEINSINKKANEIEVKLDDKVEKKSFEDLSTKFAEQEVSLEGITNRVGATESKTKELVTNIDLTKKDLTDKINNGINEAKDFTNVQISNIDKKVHNVESSLDIMTEEIKSKVSQSDIDESIKKVQFGTRNFALGTVEPSVQHGNNTTNQIDKLYDFSTTEPLLGQDVSIAFEWEVEGEEVQGSFYVQLNNEPYTNLSEVLNLSSKIRVTKNNKSGFESFKTKFPEKISPDTKYIVCRKDNMLGTLTIKNFIITIGTMTATWSPAPEDVQGQIKGAIEYTDSSIKNVSSEIVQLSNSVETKITSLDDKTKKLEYDLENKAGKVEVEDLKKEYADQKVSLEGITNRVGNTEVEAQRLSTTISNVNRDLTNKINNDVQNAVDNSKKYTDVQLHLSNEKISTVESNLNILKGQIESTVTRDEMDKVVKEIRIGTRNFALGTVEPSVQHGNNTTNQIDKLYDFSTTDQLLGQDVSITFEWGVEGYNPSGNFLIQLNNEPYTNLSPTIRVSPQNLGGFVNFTTKFPDKISSLTKYMVCRKDYMIGTLTIKNFIITVGNIKATWTPAPEDVQGQIQENIQYVDKKFNKVSSRITQLEDGIEQEVSKLTGTTKDLERQLGDKATNSQVSELNQQIATQSTSLEGIRNRVQETESRTERLSTSITDVNRDLNNKIDVNNRDLNNKLEANNNSLNNKIGDTARDLSEKLKNYTDVKFNLINTDFSTVKSDLSILKEEIKSSVSKTEVNGMIANIQTGARNFAKGTIKPVSQYCNNYNNQVDKLYDFTTIDFMYGQDVSITFEWGVISDNPTGSFVVQLGCSPYTELSTRVEVARNRTGGFVNFTTKFPISLGDLNRYIACRKDYMIGTLTIKNFMITVGNTKTTWVPAPEDVQGGFKELVNYTDMNIRNVNTSIKQTADGIRQEVSDINYKTNKLKDDLNNVNGSVENISKSMTSFDTKLGVINGRVEDVEGAYKTVNGELSNKVSNQTFSDYKQTIDKFKFEIGQKISISNLVSNGNFEGGTRCWGNQGTFFVSNIDGYGFKGRSCGTLENNNTYGSSSFYSDSGIRIKKNSVYTVNFKYVLEQACRSMEVQVVLSNSPNQMYGNQITLFSATGGNYTDNGNEDCISRTFNSSGYEYCFIKVIHYGLNYSTTGSNRLYISDIAIYEGDVGKVRWLPEGGECYSSTMTFDKDGLECVFDDGSSTKMGKEGFEWYNAGTGRKYHALTYTTSFNIPAGNPGRTSVTLPVEFTKRKDSLRWTVALRGYYYNTTGNFFPVHVHCSGVGEAREVNGLMVCDIEGYCKIQNANNPSDIQFRPVTAMIIAIA